ncbi:EamA family transporter [Flavobacterium salilacus subsp. salilacus]|uniref:DMT family transporter n=1 Tax=Flavobacterium TaxID=237 RepID=UPI001074FDCC|nr:MULTISPECIES: DMT family transporter [Flavobacterium]KAF2515784.1 EamA family transporter [Flavobacterium salilacus subsp. salilacus]MBE1615414.1 EamA family transporter [Flavobacterium sp. SaA2.13]
MKSVHLKWYLLILLSLTWGSSFILIKRGLVGLTPFQLGSLRIIFSALFLLIIGFKSLKKIPKPKWKYLMLTALFGTFLPVYLFSVAQTEIHSSISAILNSLTPLGTLIIGAALFGVQFQKRQLFGVLIGLVGCTLLIFKGALDNPNQNYYYTLFVVVAATCYATNVNLIKKHLSDVSPLSITVGNFAVMLLPALVILFFSGFADVAAEPETLHAMFFVAILGLIGTALANIVFFKLIHISSPIFASSVTYMIPVVAFGWGLFDNESLSLLQVLGAAIILLGVYFSSKK